MENNLPSSQEPKKAEIDPSKTEMDPPKDPSSTSESPEDLIKQAISKKNEGNQFFKLTNYTDAIDCYTCALQTMPDDQGLQEKATIHFNMAMALFKIV